MVGATGFFGSLLVRELRERIGASYVLAGRRMEALESFAATLQAERTGSWKARFVDLHDDESVDAGLADVDLVICAAGPFQRMPTTLARRCMERGVHYIDLADDRGFIGEVRRLAIEDGRSLRGVVCTGWSTLPALTSVMARLALDEIEQVDAIEIEMAPGNRVPRARATVGALLASVSSTFALPRSGRMVEIHGWSEPAMMRYPAPVGKRRGFLLNAPEYDLFPEMFEAESVSFRVGAEIGFFNHMVSTLAWMHRRGIVRDWVRFTDGLRWCMARFGFLGTETGGIGVRVEGLQGDGTRLTRQVSIVADRMSHVLPIVPALLMAEKIVNDEQCVGLVSYDDWIDEATLREECQARGFELFVERSEC